MKVTAVVWKKKPFQQIHKELHSSKEELENDAPIPPTLPGESAFPGTQNESLSKTLIPSSCLHEPTTYVVSAVEKKPKLNVVPDPWREDAAVEEGAEKGDSIETAEYTELDISDVVSDSYCDSYCVEGSSLKYSGFTQHSQEEKNVPPSCFLHLEQYFNEMGRSEWSGEELVLSDYIDVTGSLSHVVRSKFLMGLCIKNSHAKCSFFVVHIRRTTTVSPAFNLCQVQL